MERGISIQDYLKHQITEFKNIRKKLSVNLNPEMIHDLRVSIRRIRVVLKILSDAGKAPLDKNNEKVLRALWDVISHAREADVSQGLAEEYHLKEKITKTEQDKSREKLHLFLRRKEVLTLIRELERVAKDKKFQNIDVNPSLKNLLRKVKKTKVDKSELHPIRILLKKVRYVMEVLSKEDDEFKKYQDRLGDLNDLEVFTERYGENESLKSDHKKAHRKAVKIIVCKTKT